MVIVAALPLLDFMLTLTCRVGSSVKEDPMYDAIIVGGGPAGLAAALTLGRSHRGVLLLDAGQGRNAPAAAVHNLLAHDGTPPAELRRIGREQLARYPDVELREATVADAHAPAEAGFRLELRGGDSVEARRLLLATGLADELPAIDGLAALWGRSAFHCPYCHGFEVSGRRLAVLGAGPERVRLALHLTSFTDDLVLCTNGEPLPRDLAELLAANGVPVRGEPVTRFEGDGDRLERIVLRSGEPLDRDAVFIPTVLRQRSDLAGRLGCALLPDGCVEVDEFARTSVPGVYAAGDMAHRATLPTPFAAVSWASASGTLAGAMLDQDLIGTDFKLPSPASRSSPARGQANAVEPLSLDPVP
jgi:thioredoxin reductase